MDETSLSLLDRLRDAPDEEAWRRWAELYTPLIRSWLRQFPVWQTTPTTSCRKC